MHLETITRLFRNKNETIYKQIPFVLFLLNSNLTDEIFYIFWRIICWILLEFNAKLINSKHNIFLADYKYNFSLWIAFIKTVSGISSFGIYHWQMNRIYSTQFPRKIGYLMKNFKLFKSSTIDNGSLLIVQLLIFGIQSIHIF